jgi:hypothetical protein
MNASPRHDDGAFAAQRANRAPCEIAPPWAKVDRSIKFACQLRRLRFTLRVPH